MYEKILIETRQYCSSRHTDTGPLKLYNLFVKKATRASSTDAEGFDQFSHRIFMNIPHITVT